jgi:hypothetical protein
MICEDKKKGNREIETVPVGHRYTMASMEQEGTSKTP